jgi:O-Antigen ligase
VLTFGVPMIIYLLSYPVMLITLFRVEVGILFVITVVPIIAVMKKIATFPNGNNFVDFLMLSIILGWFFKKARENKPFLLSSPVNFAVGLMVIGSLINLIRGYTFMDFDAETNLTRLMTWKNYMILPLLYFISLNNINEERMVKRILVCISLSMIAMVFNFYSTFRLLKTEHYSHSIRIAGPFSFLGPNEMGIFFAMYSFLLLGISYFIDDRKVKYLMLFACSLSLYPIIYSYSRTTYVAVLACVAVLGFLKDRRFLVALIVIVVMYRLILPTSVIERIDMSYVKSEEVSEEKSRLSGFEVGDVTVLTGRQHLWERALEYFSEQPILGIGFDTFRFKEGMITHSTYMKILAEQGLVGVMIFVIFMGTVIKQTYRLFRVSKSRLRRGVGLGFLLCITANLVGGSQGDQTLYYNIMAFFWLFLGIVARLSVESEGGGDPDRSSDPVEKILGLPSA